MPRVRILTLTMAGLTLVLLTSFGCGSTPNMTADVKSIYARSAVSEVRNPVIVIHGVLGSRLEERASGRVVWGAFSGDYLSPETPEGARSLALPFDRTAQGAQGFSEENEAVRATGPVDKIKVDFLFFSVNVNVYAGILRSLGVGGYRDSVIAEYDAPDYANHFTCYSFFYDWRQDCIANAQRLAKHIREKRADIEERLPETIAALRDRATPDAVREAEALQAMLDKGFRFDVVAHSMGGLVARWFLRYGEQDLPEDGGELELDWAGARDIDRLILVGTPNHGSALALERLCEGFQPASITPNYDPALIGNMPALYQLLPRARHAALVDDQGLAVNHMDPELWIENRWGMLRPESSETLGWLLPELTPEERELRAAQSIRAGLRRAKRFHAALDRSAVSAPSTRIHLFAADAEDTPLQWRLERNSEGRLKPNFAAPVLGAGDGTVARSSAVADDRERDRYEPYLISPVPWHNVTFISDDHVGLTSNPTFTNNVLHLLLEEPPRH